MANEPLMNGDKKVEGDLQFLEHGRSGKSRSGMSNQCILIITMLSFLFFVIAEIIGALAGNSKSLLGDAAAMSIDVVSYICNIYIERLKEREGKIPKSTLMWINVIIPAFSLVALIGVTLYITIEAIADIMVPPEDDDVSIPILYGFASANFLVDILSVVAFYCKGKEALYSIHGVGDTRIYRVSRVTSDDNEERLNDPFGPTSSEINLNMASALTHVGGDTLRTFSIFFAAVVATVTDIPGYLCDAWAAVIVTITIVGLIVPLSIEICKAYFKLRSSNDSMSDARPK